MKKILLAFLLSPLALRAQVDFQSSNLPIVLIETNGEEIPNEPKITATMRIIDNGPGQINHIDDPANAYDGLIGIELRGSTSLDLSDKKPYAVETRDVDGEDLAVPLLGMAEESDWAFLAPFNDKSLIRDAITLALARRIMPWASNTRYVELVLNGEYEGIYLIAEKIKRDKNRVDISKLEPEDVAGDDLTGGYILKLDKTSGAPSEGWTSPYDFPHNTYYQIEYPKLEDITPEQKNYIRTWMTDFELSMIQDDYDEPGHGFQQYLDLESFVDFVIINEISKNVDAYRLSTYLYKDKDSKSPLLHAGPVWDFNISMGNADYCGGDTYYGWAMDFNDQCPNDGWIIPFWWNRLWDAPAFRQKVQARWNALRAGVFSDLEINNVVDSLYLTVNEAADRNFERWPILNNWVWPNVYCCGTYQQHYVYLDNWLADRINWLDGAMQDIYVGVYDTAEYFPPKLYPNPNNGTMNFEYYARHGGLVQIEIFDAIGRQTDYVQETVNQHGDHVFPYSASLAQGIYYYTVRIDGKEASKGRFVVHP